MGRETGQKELSCVTCGSESVIEIALTLPDGTEVAFYTCHQCEARWWNRGDESLDLEVVLDLARKPKSA
jgi:transcription elongation factor Elf1